MPSYCGDELLRGQALKCWRTGEPRHACPLDSLSMTEYASAWDPPQRRHPHRVCLPSQLCAASDDSAHQGVKVVLAEMPAQGRA